mmetsp:Transcript_175049/g.561372  ORF Transcript_175049/g.561372 Transcript_175049/m.561372 type:complete len:403 (-) Transcript_175049:54-1262(-)
MNRRIEGLGSSVKAVRKRAWKEESDDEGGKTAPPPPAPGSDSEEHKVKAEVQAKRARAKAKAALQKAKSADGSEDELDALLDEALEGGDEDGAVPPPPPPPATGSTSNPVVWMDISVAGKPRGRLHFELFRDVVPKTAENFRLLCLGVQLRGRDVGYRGSELHKVVPGKVAEGGEFDTSASGSDFEDESFKLTHSRAGLLSMCGAGPDANASRFQVLLRPAPELDNKQVVFGQILPYGPEGDSSAERLHALHWVEGMGTRSGTTREAIAIEECGELDAAEAAKALGIAKVPEEEEQEKKYRRGGLRPPRLSDAVQRENLADVLQLTADSLDSWEWQITKAQRASDKERARDIEAGMKPLTAVLEEAKYKAGSVQGTSGVHGRNAQCQQLRLRELQESLEKFF